MKFSINFLQILTFTWLAEGAKLVNLKSHFHFQPSYGLYEAVRLELGCDLESIMIFDVAPLEINAVQLRREDRAIKIYIHTEDKTRNQRIKSAIFNHTQTNCGHRKGYIMLFEEEDVNVPSIEDERSFYGGFLFITPVS